MKEEIVTFVTSIVNQREYLLKSNKSLKNRAVCYRFLKRVKANLIGRRKLTEVAAKKIFFSFRNEIEYLIPDGKNPAFKAKKERFEKILEKCI